MSRIHVVVDDHEHEAFRAQAAAEGRSLSDWFREAARQRLRDARPQSLRTPEQLDEFFAACDAREGDEQPEPDWDEHRAVIDESRRQGLPQP